MARPGRTPVLQPASRRGRTPGLHDYNSRSSFTAVQSMEQQHRNVLVLSACQATLQTTTVMLVAVTGLAGYALAAEKSFATVPLTCYVLGSAVSTIPASLLMHTIGRRGG